ncbi:unnamed protein product, partial [Amoebophrya sp. A25]
LGSTNVNLAGLVSRVVGHVVGQCLVFSIRSKYAAVSL